LFEGFQPGFFLLLLVLLPILFWKKQRAAQAAMMALMVGLVIFSFAPIHVPLQGALRDFRFHAYQEGESRYSGVNNELKKFLDARLEKNQTFFENVNSHLLYTLAEREAPMFHQAQQIIASEAPQVIYVKQLGKLYQEEKIPVVILDSSSPYRSRLDDIPSTFGTYLISEFLYPRYVPWVWVDGQHLWIDARSGLLKDEPGGQIIATLRPNKGDDEGAAIGVGPGGAIAGNEPVTLFCGAIAYPLSGEVILRPDEPQSVVVNIAVEGETQVLETLDFDFEFENGIVRHNAVFVIGGIGREEFSVYVPVPEEGNGVLRSIRLTPPSGSPFLVLECDIVKYEGVSIPGGSIQQSCNLIFLPYVWANKDAKIAQNGLPETILPLASNLMITDEAEIQIDGELPRGRASYLYLEISLADTQDCKTVKIEYGEPQSVFTFTVLPGTHPYLLRMSSQYNWMQEAQASIRIRSDWPIEILTLSVLAGD
jgi:hypothetical protein